MAAIFTMKNFTPIANGHTLWSSTAAAGDSRAPAFGHATIVYNVIDARQAYLQNVVTAGLRALGFDEQADRSIHFSYEIVALTPRCAAELGYTLSEEDAKKPYVEVSGRKGLGVKADDLLDRLEAAARAEVDERHPDSPDLERAAIAHCIAIGALRYFLLKFTRTAIIAFDFKDALSFEGETGPYCQYAVVRARNIFRKLREQQPDFDISSLETVDVGAAAELFAGPDGNALWEVVLLAGSLDTQIDAAVAAQEPAFVAKYAFQLAQAFNLFYHHHRVLTEDDRCQEKIPVAAEPPGRSAAGRRAGIAGHRIPRKNVVAANAGKIARKGFDPSGVLGLPVHRACAANPNPTGGTVLDRRELSRRSGNGRNSSFRCPRSESAEFFPRTSGMVCRNVHEPPFPRETQSPFREMFSAPPGAAARSRTSASRAWR